MEKYKMLDLISDCANKLKGYTIYRLIGTTNETGIHFGNTTTIKEAAIRKEYVFARYKGDNLVTIANKQYFGDMQIHHRDMILSSIQDLYKVLSYNMTGDIAFYHKTASINNETSKEEALSINPDTSFLEPRNKLINDMLICQSGVLNDTGIFIQYKSISYEEGFNQLYADESTNEYIVYLPIEWVRYAGYDENVVNDYLELLSSIFTEEIKMIVGKIPKSLVINRTGYSGRGNMIFNPDAYIVGIKNVQSSISRTCLIKLLCYLYNGYYNNIPGFALKVKNSLSLEDLQTLLFAHYTNLYSNPTGLQVDFNGSSYLFPDLKVSPEDFIRHIYKTNSFTLENNIELNEEQYNKIYLLLRTGDLKSAHDYVISLPTIKIPQNSPVPKRPRRAGDIKFKANNHPLRGRNEVKFDVNVDPIPHYSWEIKMDDLTFNVPKFVNKYNPIKQEKNGEIG